MTGPTKRTLMAWQYLYHVNLIESMESLHQKMTVVNSSLPQERFAQSVIEYKKQEKT